MLRKQTLSALAAVEQAKDVSTSREALADVVVELTKSGLDYYFMRPLELSKAGFVTQQAANLGMAGVRQLLATAIRNVIGRMDQPQMLSVSRSIRELML